MLTFEASHALDCCNLLLSPSEFQAFFGSDSSKASSSSSNDEGKREFEGDLGATLSKDDKARANSGEVHLVRRGDKLVTEEEIKKSETAKLDANAAEEKESGAGSKDKPGADSNKEKNMMLKLPKDPQKRHRLQPSRRERTTAC